MPGLLRRRFLSALVASALLVPLGGRADSRRPKGAGRDAAVASPAARGGDPSWLLRPEVYGRLSAGGRRAARFLNGLAGPAPARPAPHAEAAPRPLASVAPRQNIRVNDPSLDALGNANSESSVAVRGSNIVVGFNDASQDVSAYGFSTDGGASFTHRRLAPPFGGHTFGDPVVAFGPNGEVYYSTLMLQGGDFATSIGVAKSTDGGATFGALTDVSLYVENGVDSHDKDWLAVDAGANSPKKGNVYVSWTDFLFTGETTILFARSTDGGQTFSVPGSLSPVDFAGVQNSTMAVAPNGDLYVAWEDGHLSPDGISVAKSTDGGSSFGSTKTVATFNPLVMLTGGGGVRASSYAVMAVDGAGVLHLAFAAASSGATVDRSDIFHVRSSDGGSTFSAPRKLNDDGTATTQAFPALAAASDGSVAVKWADRRNDPVNDGLTDVYMSISRDGGATFGKSFRITDHNWVYGPVDPNDDAGYHGDYDGLAADGGSFYLSWSDERDADPDVYFTSVPASFDAGAPDFDVSARNLYGIVKTGQAVSFELATSGANGFGGSLVLSAGPAADSLSYAFSAGTVAAGETSRLTISASALAEPGDYLVTVTATGAGLTRATNVRLTVYDSARALGPPANVTATPGFTAGAGVKADANGVLHLVYEDDTAAVLGEDVFYRRSTDGGLTFSAPRKLNASGSVGVDSVLFIDSSGRLNVAWSGTAGSDSSNRVYFTRSTDGGASFSSPVAATSSGQSALYPTVAVDKSGNILIAYYQTSGQLSLAFVRSTNGGSSFTGGSGIGDTAVSTITRPGLAFDSKGTAFLVYTDQVATIAGLSSVARLGVFKAGSSTGTLSNLSDPNDTFSFAPDVAVGADDSVVVAFYNRLVDSLGNSNREIVAIRSTDGGSTFSSQVGVSSNAGQSYFPAVLVEAGGAIDVAWEDSSGNGQTDVFLSRSTNAGQSFSTPLNVSSNPGLSGSAANSIEPLGGSGRAALSVGAGGTILVSWTDDSPANPDLFLAAVNTATASNNPPTAAITAPSPGFSVEAGVPVTFTGTGGDPEGGPVTFSWGFGDGTAATGASPDAHPFAAPGTYTVTLTTRDALGAATSVRLSVTVTAPSVTGTSLLLPVALDTPGLNGSHYSSEVTLVSRATGPTDVLLTYTASAGSGSGHARLTLGPGEMRVLPGIIGYLRGRNLAIPNDGSPQIGTLLATFGGVTSPSTVFAGARTYTADPAGGAGTFGFFSPAARTTTVSATLFGLQQNGVQRSNVAVVNAGPDTITLRVSLEGANGEDLGALPDRTLGPWGWFQFGQPLLGKAASGRAVVTRVSGSSPFSAYAALNDEVTSDGSYVPPEVPGDSSGAERLVPVVLDVQGLASRFRTELTLTNFTMSPMPLTLVYRAATRYGLGSGSGSAGLTLGPGEQRIIPDAISFLRGTLPIESDGRNVGGSLLVQLPAGTAAESLAVGARTFAPSSPSGSFGFFDTGITPGQSATSIAWLYGLQENADQRSNVAVVNRGDAGDTITLRLTYFDASGAALGAPVDQDLAPGEWFQFNRPLAALHAAAGYVKVERISGSSRFAANAVLNDNSTQDGSTITMSF